MKSIKYISMQKDVFNRQLGGFSHFKGVSKVLSSNYKLTVVGYNVGKLNLDGLIYKEIPARFYGSFIFLNWFFDFNSDVVLARKTLIGSLIVSLFFPIKKLFLLALGKKQALIYEYNGISGEFILDGSALFSKVLLWLNIIPTICSDYTYCVNDYIKNRLYSPFNIGKLFVCENGGPDPIYKSSAEYEDGSFGMVFYGANQAHYDISALVDAVKEVNRKGVDFKLFLVGPDMGHYAQDNVLCVGVMNREKLADYLSSRKELLWGVIPLKGILAERDVKPIKVFDYMSLGLPVVHSEFCLEGFEKDEAISVLYSDPINGISEITSIDLNAYNHKASRVRDLYEKYLWKETLIPMLEVIDEER